MFRSINKNCDETLMHRLRYSPFGETMLTVYDSLANLPQMISFSAFGLLTLVVTIIVYDICDNKYLQ